jgi:hypothetical protein
MGPLKEGRMSQLGPGPCVSTRPPCRNGPKAHVSVVWPVGLCDTMYAYVGDGEGITMIDEPVKPKFPRFPLLLEGRRSRYP